MQSVSSSPFQLPHKTPFGLLEGIAEKVTGLSTLDRHYQNKPSGLDTERFLRYTLESLGVDYQVLKGSVDAIPQKGATVVVANHPFGCIEGVILAELLLKHRPDIQVLANELLKNVPELDSLFIGVDVFGSQSSMRTNVTAVRKAHKHLSDGGCLLVFPAGEVSSVSNFTTSPIDKSWSLSTSSLIKKHKATAVPIFIHGKNSKAFYYSGLIHPILRTTMLGRELLNKKGSIVGLSIGDAIKYKEVKDLQDQELIDYLRLNTYLLESNTANSSRSLNVKHLERLIDPIEPKQVEIELEPITPLLISNNFEVYCSDAQSIPNTLTEIGRVREQNFRMVGEGTGKSVDLDDFDECYLHLFVWDRDKRKIVGAYRLGLVDKLLEQSGLSSLYTRTLFQFEMPFLEKMGGKAIEMGRSVIDLEYQKSSNALLLLWKGIAKFVSLNPQYTHLFGPVSISNDYSAQVRQLLAEAMMEHHFDNDIARQVSPSHPLEIRSSFLDIASLSALKDVQLLSRLISRLDKGKTVPVLLKQYLGLNGKLVCFNIDPDFNNALDGLIVVDLRKVEPRVLGKYMGKGEAEEYLQRSCQ